MKHSHNQMLKLDSLSADLIYDALSRSLAGVSIDIERDAELLAACASQHLQRLLPPQVLKSFRQFVEGKRVFLAISGFKLEDFIGATPQTPDAFPWIGDISAAILLGCAFQCGKRPLSFEFENKGQLIRNVAPMPGADKTLSSHGSEVTFNWHADNPQVQHLLNTLAFIAMRNLERVGTEILLLDHVVSLLDRETIERAQKPLFSHRGPASNDKGASGVCDVPLLTREHGVWKCWYDCQCTFPTDANDKEAAAVLVAFDKAILQAERGGAAISIILERGDFLIFDNARVLHRRKSFTPHNRPELRRWLARLYGTTEFHDADFPDPAGRPFMVK